MPEHSGHNVHSDGHSESGHDSGNSSYNHSVRYEKTYQDTPIWINDPNILLNSGHVLNFFPTELMTIEEKLNSVTRIILLLTIIGFCITRKVRILLIGGISLFSVYIFYTTLYSNKESFITDSGVANNEPTSSLYANNKYVDMSSFTPPTDTNPFSNVLMTDYKDNVNRKPAPPSFNPDVNAQILEKAKQLVCNLNGTDPDIANKLFGGLGDEFEFEQSMRQFHSTSATTIPNDQQAFGEFCFGEMISRKEGNPLAILKGTERYNLY